MSESGAMLRVIPVDPTSAERQARMRAKLGAPVKAYLDPQLRERLERCAARQQSTLASLLRDALEYYLEDHEPDISPPLQTVLPFPNLPTPVFLERERRERERAIGQTRSVIRRTGR